MRIVTLAAAAAIAAVPAAAHAAPSVYGSINVGGATTSDVASTVYAPGGAIFGEGGISTFSVATAPAGSDTIEGSYDVKTAFAVSGALGLDWGLVRTEAELSYSRSTVRAFNVGKLTSGNGGSVSFADACGYVSATCPVAGSSIPLGGAKLRQLSGMANVWVDLPIPGPVEPYVGGGIGINGVESDGEAKGKFAWQVGGGVAFKPMPKLAVTADVRYRVTDPISFDFGGGEGLLFGRVKTVTYGLGLRYTF